MKVTDRSLAGKYLDGLAFAKMQGRLEGVLAWEDLPRLADFSADSVSRPEGKLVLAPELAERSATGLDRGLGVVVVGVLDAQRRPMLELDIAGTVWLECQRCLQVLAWPLDLHVRLRLIVRPESWPEDDLEDDAADAIEAGVEMSVVEMVEDEVLLALPMVPMHEQCGLPMPKALIGRGGKQEVSKEGAPRKSAFAALAVLKTK